MKVELVALRRHGGYALDKKIEGGFFLSTAISSRGQIEMLLPSIKQWHRGFTKNTLRVMR